MTTFSKQAELDFMHNFRHATEGDRWALHEIETLRRQVVVLREFVEEIANSTPSDDADGAPDAAWEFLKKFDKEFT